MEHGFVSYPLTGLRLCSACGTRLRWGSCCRSLGTHPRKIAGKYSSPCRTPSGWSCHCTDQHQQASRTCLYKIKQSRKCGSQQCSFMQPKIVVGKMAIYRRVWALCICCRTLLESRNGCCCPSIRRSGIVCKCPSRNRGTRQDSYPRKDQRHEAASKPLYWNQTDCFLYKNDPNTQVSWLMIILRIPSGSMQCPLHSSCDEKRFSLPSHPPYQKREHPPYSMS